MKFLWLFVLVCFTTSDGGPVWIAKEQVVAVNRHYDSGTPIDPSRQPTTVIFMSSGNQFYVTEAPDLVAEKLK